TGGLALARHGVSSARPARGGEALAGAGRQVAEYAPARAIRPRGGIVAAIVATADRPALAVAGGRRAGIRGQESRNRASRLTPDARYLHLLQNEACWATHSLGSSVAG